MKGSCSKDESRNSTESERSTETRFTHRSTPSEEDACTSSPREHSYKRHRHFLLGRTASKKARAHPLLMGDADCSSEEEENSSFLDDIIQQLSRDHLELSANDSLHLERSARNALRITLGWVDQNLQKPAPCCPDIVALQLLNKRLLLLRQSFEEDKLLDAAQLLTALFLLVVRGTIFCNVPLEPWDVVDLSGSRPRVNSLPRLRATLLHYLSPLCSCLLPHLLMALPNTLYLCQQLIQDLCPSAHAESVKETTVEPHSIRIPSGIQAIVLDLDDTVFLHQQVRQLREVYWVLAQARGSVRGIDADLLRDVVMPAVPNRDFLLRLVDSMHASGRAVYVASFGLNEWVRPVVELVFGDRIPAERVYSLEGHPPRHPVVLNKNLWLAEVMERHCISPRKVLLVDDQISNVARALAGGFSALQVPPSRGLDWAIWGRALCNATADHHLLPPPPRTHAYCPASGAIFADDLLCCDADEETYEPVATQVNTRAPEGPGTPSRVPSVQEDAAMTEDTSCETTLSMTDTDMAEGPAEVPQAPSQGPAKGLAKGPATPGSAASAFASAAFKERRAASHGDLQTVLQNVRPRFILKHKDFEVVRSLTTPPRPASRHARARSLGKGTPQEGPLRPRTSGSPSKAGSSRPPLYQGPRGPARGPLEGSVAPVRMRQVAAAGPWMTGNPLEQGRDVGNTIHITANAGVQSTLQCPGLCAQMARLGMATEA